MKIKKRGFTFAIEDLEFFVPVTSETLSEQMHIYNNSETLEQEFLKEAKHLFTALENSGDDFVKKEESFNQLLEQRKIFLKKMYDMFLGEGAFEKLYAYHPHIDDLEETLPDVLKEYLKKLEPFLQEQTQKNNQAIEKAKNKRKKRLKK